MKNELLLVTNLVVIYSMTLVFFRLFGKKGLYCWNVLATVAANIEVTMLVYAFGMEQTLGNILFASTFITTDILSENYGKKDANFAVKTGIAASVAFIVITRFWMYFIPSENDFVTPAVREVFANTPRIMISGLLVYAIVQFWDIWVYHKIWDWTTKKFGAEKKYLWLRNNGSTLSSQLVNAVLFNLFAFWGIYDTKTLISIILSTYAIYIITSLADTPLAYVARKMKKND